MLFLGVWRLRKTQPDAKRLIRVPALPVFVLLAIAGTGYALYGFVPANITSFALSCVVAAIGLIVYAAQKRATNQLISEGQSMDSIQLCFSFMNSINSLDFCGRFTLS
ncbi:hypothetical protein JCM19232_3315 [Vibrio ishigakensis]|uniref:Uncharacterized protein n=1 Tax=Vibrio ishigakensis TaxID=1481914 RepID=A0A0B8PMW5_9VIBR|nr:hypothetical protein JCM19232_3315 [Vibrio ishigakensis]